MCPKPEGCPVWGRWGGQGRTPRPCGCVGAGGGDAPSLDSVRFASFVEQGNEAPRIAEFPPVSEGLGGEERHVAQQPGRAIGLRRRPPFLVPEPRLSCQLAAGTGELLVGGERPGEKGGRQGAAKAFGGIRTHPPMLL